MTGHFAYNTFLKALTEFSACLFPLHVINKIKQEPYTTVMLDDRLLYMLFGGKYFLSGGGRGSTEMNNLIMPKTSFTGRKRVKNAN